MNTKIGIETDSYNERRYGKPWIAVVVFDDPTKPAFNFGTWVGDKGYSGVLEISAKRGDIIARGQKDLRKPSNSAPTYYIYDDTIDDLTSNYDIPSLGFKCVTKKDAYLHYKSLKNNQ